MKTLYTYLVSMMLLLANAQAQEKPFPLGSTARLLQSFRQQARTSAEQRGTSSIQLGTSMNNILQGRVNYRQSTATDDERIIGTIENTPGSSFYIQIAHGMLQGNILLRNSQKAYRYYSDSSGNAFVREVDIRELLCINYDQGPLSNQPAAVRALAIVVPPLESFPGGNGCILLDFDGQYVSGTPWNNGNPIDALPADMTESEIAEAWEMVAEDFRPFHVNVTTNEAVFNTYPRTRRMRCIITPTNTAAPGAGGVAYIGSFNWDDETPCWVFNMGAKYAGEAASHEVGHTFGLGHDGRTSPQEEYYGGQGDWAPIMGVGYYKNIVQWSKGEYNNANNKEDDVTKIASPTYGVGYKEDDHGNAPSAATPLIYDVSGHVAAAQNAGLVERSNDQDVFSFATAGGQVVLRFDPAARHGDLDILAILYDSSGNIIKAANANGLPASIDTTLAPGRYYLSIDGTGTGDPVTDGYSDYASTGYYTISGNVPPVGITKAAASFYQHCWYDTSGYGIAFEPGNYTTDRLTGKGILNNDISSLKVQNGYEVVLYKEDNFKGGHLIFTADTSCLAGAGFNDSTSSLRVRSVNNQPPVISITSPASGTYFPAPASIAINVSATDADGAISKVEFFNGTAKLGETSTAPYSFTWSQVPAGSYTVTATATDDRNGTTSAQVSVISALPVATFYQHCNYDASGYAVSLVPGSYDLDQLTSLGIRNDDISSLKVQSGYEVVLYQHSNFQGDNYTFNSDVPCLVSVNINDWTSSLVIRAATGAAPIAAAARSSKDEGRLLIAPNPFTDQLIIQYPHARDEYFHVRIFDISGSLVVPAQRIRNGQRLNLSQLNAGMYIIKLSVGKEEITRKLIKVMRN